MELLDVIDKNGNLTGEVLDKIVIRERNLLHKVVCLFIINSKNQVLLEKRSMNKKIHPGKLGLCEGHVHAGEDTMSGIIRELEEELGVIANKEDITYFCTILKERTTNSNITYAYYMFLDKETKDFAIQEEELSEVMWMDFNEYKNMIINNNPTVVFSNNEGNIRMLNTLEDIISKRFNNEN